MLADINVEQMNFYIGQVFKDTYPPEASIWCYEQGKCSINRLSDGTFKIESIPDQTDDELKERGRQKRDILIAQTDYLLMVDYPISAEDLEAVKKYRQALRDVPQQKGFPKSISWPELPAFLKE